MIRILEELHCTDSGHQGDQGFVSRENALTWSTRNMASIKLLGAQNELGRSRRRYGEKSICTLQKMKKVMRNQFMPSAYREKFLEQLNRLKQGSKSVKEYHMELLNLMIKANAKKGPDAFNEAILG
ncbi:hypothetical protein PIB30_040386 [Stylosanthes scabra]|uniref:Retrotransposon gag domain-containing protein n=1 Tax=Stylosanthes scabra TaxID=79078 RepID=A0ABU6ZD96_9FABA|nr:hypothetical protein [Stylosanthes scabra]